ncbi:TIGR03915 family putative DNA repair protein [Sungkyunkwania multivorans]|uniref:TIGR03915 family putative DNA repair protein n=1 Tax=Sungkyunkwania multivorans TaxID=1173618 RepID=A0ABW3CW80_9FLAO
MTNLNYDGTFDGFLSAVFDIYEQRLGAVSIQPKLRSTETFFDETIEVMTEERKAIRVWRGISKKCSSRGRSNCYRAFLSELPGIENKLLHFIRRSLAEKQQIDQDFADPIILDIAKTVKMVGREKHRMDAFIRFRRTKDDIYFATIAPDFNVLPLNIAHFKNRYADQKWLIYDLKRNYGAYYDLKTVEQVTLEVADKNALITTKLDVFTEDELAFQELWKNYFKSTNIPSRKNNKLHLQHVPKRYWRYLSEKSPI